MKFFPLQPLIFIAAYLFVGVSIAIQTPGTALVGVAVLAAFMLIYFIAKKFSTQGPAAAGKKEVL